MTETDLLHEIGHALGFRHTQGDLPSAMAPDSPAMELSATDREDFCLFYGATPICG